jgi:hypothetical protein
LPRTISNQIKLRKPVSLKMQALFTSFSKICGRKRASQVTVAKVRRSSRGPSAKVAE